MTSIKTLTSLRSISVLIFNLIYIHIYDDLTLSYALFGDPLDLVCHNELDIKDTTDTQCPTIEVQIVR